MNPLTTLEAYDLLRHAARLSDRLAQAEADHLSREGLEPEKRWLSEAAALVQAQLPGVAELLARARELPELELVREDYSEELQDAWVDCLERLHAALILNLGSRAPILETLFPHLKFPALRRASQDGVRTYAAEFDRRSRLGYVKRILGQPDAAFAEPLVLAIPETLERWEACFRPSQMSEEDAAPLRAELAEVAYRVERFMRQGRLLAEAALAPLDGEFESTGIGRWPRRRVGSVETEAPPPLDGAPHDDGVPLAEALGWGQEAKPESASGSAAAGPSSTDVAVHAGAPVDDAASARGDANGDDRAAVREAPVDDAAVVDPPADDPKVPSGPPEASGTVNVSGADGVIGEVRDAPAEVSGAALKPGTSTGGSGKTSSGRKASGKRRTPEAPALTDASAAAPIPEVASPEAPQVSPETIATDAPAAPAASGARTDRSPAPSAKRSRKSKAGPRPADTEG